MDWTCIKHLAFGLMFAGVSGASAAAATFTWNPAQASPALAGSAFTADRIVTSNYLYARQPATDLTPFPERFLFSVTGFTLQGVPVTPAGFGTAYGLYFIADEVDVLNAGQAITQSGTIRLMADPTNNDGAPSATLANGIGFANPAGVADDITLATGTLLSGVLTFPNGVATKRLLETFAPAPGEAGFFAEPPAGNHTQIELFNVNTSTSRQFFLQPDGTGITLVNAANGSADIQLPEPASLLMLAAGLLGLAGLRHL